MSLIRAIWCPDHARWMTYRTRGSFYLAPRDGHPGLFDFWFFCPCGCGCLEEEEEWKNPAVLWRCQGLRYSAASTPAPASS